MGPEDLKARWNAFISDFDDLLPPLENGTTRSLTGNRTAVNYELTDLLSIEFVVEESGNVVDITALTGLVSDDAISTLDALSAITTIVAIADPDLAPEERGEIVEELLSGIEEAATTYEKTVARNGLTYQINAFSGVLTFTASAP